jgi:hypothetical protein
MSTTNKRLEALERRARKPDRVVDALRVLLVDEPATEAEMAMVRRCAQTSPVVRAMLDNDAVDSQPG